MTGNYFAALPVTVADGFLARLQRDAPAALRWFHPDDLHLTLAFFGRHNAERIPDILEVLDAIDFPCVRATLGPLRALPHSRRFSALAFDLDEGRDEVATCIARWRGPLGEASGVIPDCRPPRPHLTIARPARKHPGFHPGTTLRWIRNCDPPDRTIRIAPPALYGWSDQRPQRQFCQIH